MSKNSSPVLLIGSIAALVIYLAAPVLRIAFVLGVNGLQAMQWLSTWFIVPVIFFFAAAVIACVGSKNSAILMSGGTVVLMIVFLLALKDIAASGNLNTLSTHLGQQLGGTPESATYGSIASSLATQLLINPAWGFYLCSGCAVATFVLLFFTENKETKKAPPVSTSHSSHASYHKLYRK